MTNNYKIEIIKLSEEDGGGFLAQVPKLPGCMSDGETYEQAIESVQDAIKCWIATAEELGKPIPSPDEYKCEDEFSGKLTLRIPKSLHRDITEQAEKEGCSINQLIMMYMSLGIGNEFGKNKVSINLDTSAIGNGIVEDVVKRYWNNTPSDKVFRTDQFEIDNDFNCEMSRFS